LIKIIYTSTFLQVLIFFYSYIFLIKNFFFFFDYLLELKSAPTFTDFFIYTLDDDILHMGHPEKKETVNIENTQSETLYEKMNHVQGDTSIAIDVDYWVNIWADIKRQKNKIKARHMSDTKFRLREGWTAQFLRPRPPPPP
jgi:hypothetical protein